MQKRKLAFFSLESVLAANANYEFSKEILV